ncbi:hypothetical protein ACFLY2_01125 [Patescibacteria group bacterium]
MNELKNNLRENFIKPLKFKFLVQKLEKETQNITPPPSGTPLEKGRNQEEDEKNAMFKQIHEAYKKFNV